MALNTPRAAQQGARTPCGGLHSATLPPQRCWYNSPSLQSDRQADRAGDALALRSYSCRARTHRHKFSGSAGGSSIDGESFQTYVERVLLPTLKPGDIVIMDNLGSHKGKAVRQLIRSAGAKLIFLPKYSPDLNPIDQVFAKLKHLLRKAAARTVEAVCAAVGLLLQAFTPEECTNYFRNAGYVPCLDRRRFFRGSEGARGRGRQGGFTKSCRSPEQHFRPWLESTHKFDDRSISPPPPCGRQRCTQGT